MKNTFQRQLPEKDVLPVYRASPVNRAKLAKSNSAVLFTAGGSRRSSLTQNAHDCTLPRASRVIQRTEKPSE